MWYRYVNDGTSNRGNHKLYCKENGSTLTLPDTQYKIHKLFNHPTLRKYMHDYKKLVCVEKPENSYTLYKIVIALYRNDKIYKIIRITTRNLDELVKDKTTNKYYEDVSIDKYRKYIA